MSSYASDKTCVVTIETVPEYHRDACCRLQRSRCSGAGSAEYRDRGCGRPDRCLPHRRRGRRQCCRRTMRPTAAWGNARSGRPLQQSLCSTARAPLRRARSAEAVRAKVAAMQAEAMQIEAVQVGVAHTEAVQMGQSRARAASSLVKVGADGVRRLTRDVFRRTSSMHAALNQRACDALGTIRHTSAVAAFLAKRRVARRRKLYGRHSTRRQRLLACLAEWARTGWGGVWW